MSNAKVTKVRPRARVHAREALVKARHAKGWTQAEMAKELQCSKGTIISIENDYRLPGRALAYRMEDALGVPARAWDKP